MLYVLMHHNLNHEPSFFFYQKSSKDLVPLNQNLILPLIKYFKDNYKYLLMTFYLCFTILIHLFRFICIIFTLLQNILSVKLICSHSPIWKIQVRTSRIDNFLFIVFKLKLISRYVKMLLLKTFILINLLLLLI